MISAPFPPNRFKERLLAREVQYGLFVGLTDRIASEIVAGAGFDWMMVDAEHAPNDSAQGFLHDLVVRDQAVLRCFTHLNPRCASLPVRSSGKLCQIGDT